MLFPIILGGSLMQTPWQSGDPQQMRLQGFSLAPNPKITCAVPLFSLAVFHGIFLVAEAIICFSSSSSPCSIATYKVIEHAMLYDKHFVVTSLTWRVLRKRLVGYAWILPNISRGNRYLSSPNRRCPKISRICFASKKGPNECQFSEVIPGPRQDNLARRSFILCSCWVRFIETCFLLMVNK